MPRYATPVPTDGPPPKILLGIEQEWAARSLESVLAPGGYAVLRAHSGRETLRLARLAEPDVIIVDSRLSDIEGLDVCLGLQQRDIVAPNVPVIIMTSGAAPREFVLEAHRRGVWGVWEQPLDSEVLLLRLRTWIHAKRMADRVRDESLVDHDTGVYSYRGLNVRAAEVMADAARRRTPTSCVAVGAGPVADIRQATSDLQVDPAQLGELARWLRLSARGSDVVGRLSASGLAIVAPCTSEAGAHEMAERLRAASARLEVAEALRSAGGELMIGVVTLGEEEAETRSSSELLVRASSALRYAQMTRTTLPQSYGQVPVDFR